MGEPVGDIVGIHDTRQHVAAHASRTNSRSMPTNSQHFSGSQSTKSSTSSTPQLVGDKEGSVEGANVGCDSVGRLEGCNVGVNVGY